MPNNDLSPTVRQKLEDEKTIQCLTEIEAILTAATPGECRQDGREVHSEHFHTAGGIAHFAFERDAALFASCRRELEWAKEMVFELMAEREARA